MVLEAMRAARPVVMTNCTDTEKIIEPGINGYVVPVGDAQAMARRVEELLNDPKKRTRFGKWGRKLVEKNFLAEDSAWHLARIYVTEWENVRHKRNNTFG